MQSSYFYLTCILVLMPVLSLHSARQLRGLSPSPEVRRALWTGSASGLIALLVLAIVVGREIDYPFLALPPVSGRAIFATAGAFGVCLALYALSDRIRSEEERRSLLLRLLLPRSTRDWIVWTALVVLAGVAEEIAYRGVGMAILVGWLGDPWTAATICAAGFAAAHALQGWKSGVIIFGIALVMHALVALTGTLVYAIVVHIVYDLVAAYFMGREEGMEQGGPPLSDS